MGSDVAYAISDEAHETFRARQTDVKSGRLRQKSEQNSADLRPVKVRFAIIAFLLLMAFIILPLTGFQSVLPIALVLLLLGVVSNLISFIWILSGKGIQNRVYFATSIDFLLITIVLHYMGGIETPLTWVFTVALITIAILHGVKLAIFTAAVSSLMFSSLLVGEFMGIIPHVGYNILNIRYLHHDTFYLYIKLVSDNILFFITAAVSGLLSERLIRNKNELEKRNREIMKMQAALQEHMSDLEDTVAKRTVELTAANAQLRMEITERNQAEEALRKSEERYRDLVENMSDVVCAVDASGLFVYASPSVELLAGYKPSEVIGRPFLNFVYSEDVPRIMSNFAKLQSGSNQSNEYRFLTKGGKILWMRTSTRPTFKGNDVVGMQAVLSDITEQKRAREALEESERQYRTTLDSMGDAIHVVDKDLRILLINKALREWNKELGFETEVIGKTVFEVFPFLPAKIRDEYESVLKNGTILITEESNTIDGREVLSETRKIPILEGDRVTRIVTVIRDVTKERQLEHQLLQAQKMESVGTLAGGIAHDFNNLLAGVLGYASLIKTKIPKELQIYNYADTIERSATRAAELTSQLLAFARGGKYEAKVINLNNIISETLKIIGRTFEKSIEIETVLFETLPTIEADAGQIQQVLMNLCVNARDAMPDGGKLIIESGVVVLTDDYVKMHLGAHAGPHVVLSVTDTGIGMDRNTLKRIFEPFFTTKPEGKGTGLGLAMVYGVVKNHGGYVCAYSEPGEGSTFKVYLPVNGKQEVNELTRYEIPERGSELILVVDDEESVRALARDMLESYGYRVLLAENGAKAIEIVKGKNGSIDLVILDMIMPKMAGRETFLKLKELNPRIRVLLSTGYSQNGKAKEIMDCGVMGFLQKPYQVSALLSKVRSVLDARL